MYEFTVTVTEEKAWGKERILERIRGKMKDSPRRRSLNKDVWDVWRDVRNPPPNTHAFFIRYVKGSSPRNPNVPEGLRLCTPQESLLAIHGLFALPFPHVDERGNLYPDEGIFVIGGGNSALLVTFEVSCMRVSRYRPNPHVINGHMLTRA